MQYLRMNGRIYRICSLALKKSLLLKGMDFNPSLFN
jgi:hypothetical protein